MAITLSSAFSTAMLQHTGTTMADQIGAGTLVVYSGTPPTGANEGLSGNTVLATFTLSAAASQSTTAGVTSLALSAATVTASASGTATFFRILSSGSTSLIQGLIGVSGSDWNLSSTTVTSGDNVSITGTGTITLPVT
jgi:hypothetical protein